VPPRRIARDRAAAAPATLVGCTSAAEFTAGRAGEGLAACAVGGAELEEAVVPVRRVHERILASFSETEANSGRAHRDIVGFHAEVADATSLPLMLFNHPSLTRVDLTPPLVARLAEIPHVAYMAVYRSGMTQRDASRSRHS
jgi:hypothetical protein